jgi:tetratricopeptide (TPR) repeat protein
MGKGLIAKERGEFERSEELLAAALRIAAEAGDLETASWIRGTQASLLGMRGDPEAGVAIARRNCELTERLGDVFSRSLALANLCAAELNAEDFPAALESIEESERLYRGAMDDGGEMESWRGALRAYALLGSGRVEEALRTAEWASGIARERGMHWSLPLALHALGRARAAAGRDGVEEALGEAAAVAKSSGALVTLETIEADRLGVSAGAGG